MPGFTEVPTLDARGRTLVTPDDDTYTAIVADLRADAQLSKDRIGAYAPVLTHYADRIERVGMRPPMTADDVNTLQERLLARCSGAVRGSLNIEGWTPLREGQPVDGARVTERGGDVVFSVRLRHGRGFDVIGRGTTIETAAEDVVARWPG